MNSLSLGAHAQSAVRSLLARCRVRDLPFERRCPEQFSDGSVVMQPASLGQDQSISRLPVDGGLLQVSAFGEQIDFALAPVPAGDYDPSDEFTVIGSQGSVSYRLIGTVFEMAGALVFSGTVRVTGIVPSGRIYAEAPYLAGEEEAAPKVSFLSRLYWQVVERTKDK